MVALDMDKENFGYFFEALEFHRLYDMLFWEQNMYIRIVINRFEMSRTLIHVV